MGRGAIYVDDSGTPGVDSGSDFLPQSRKSWTAVIVPAAAAGEVVTAMDIFLTGVRGEFGADELHFTEIYSGKGVWKKVPPPKRAEMFQLMAQIMDGFALPVVHQTMSDEFLMDRPDFAESIRGFRGGGWVFDDIAHLGFFMLCSQVAKHLLDLKTGGPADFDLPMPLFVDEGLMNAGQERGLLNWSDVIEGPVAKFRRSADEPGLQIADFAAFVISRSQWVAVHKTDGEELDIADRLILDSAASLNILNLEPRRVSAKEFGRAGYEKHMSEDRIRKGLSPRPARKKR